MANAPLENGQPGESRTGSRRRVLRSGKVVLRDGSASINCSIINLSETGARIRLPHDQLIPLRFNFINVTDGTLHEATIVWYKFPDVGLRFLNSHRVDEAPEHLKPLRKLWLDCTVRRSDLS